MANAYRRYSMVFGKAIPALTPGRWPESAVVLDKDQNFSRAGQMEYGMI